MQSGREYAEYGVKWVSITPRRPFRWRLLRSLFAAFFPSYRKTREGVAVSILTTDRAAKSTTGI